jgi:hypothetical protein
VTVHSKSIGALKFSYEKSLGLIGLNMSLIGVKVCENLFMSFILNYGGLIGDFIVVENYLRAVAVEARLEDLI